MAAVVEVVDRIVRRYLFPLASVRTMASPTSVVAGNWKIALLAVIVSTSAGPQVVPPVTVTVVAVVFVPS